MNISDALVNNNVTITVAHVGSSECGVYSICSTDYISDLIINSDAVINPTIRATATTLTLQADRNITFLEGALIQASGGKLNVILNSDFDADGIGAISMYSGSAIKSNGGSITLGGGATNTSGYPIGYATGYNAETEGCSASTCGDYHAGITLLDVTLSSNNGTIQLSGRGDTGGGTGIDLRNTQIDAGNSGGVILKGEGVYSANSSGVGIAIYDNSILVAGANGINLSAKANVTSDINAQNSYALSLGDATATADTSTRIYTINGGQLTLDLETTAGTDDGSNWYFGDMMGYIGNVDQTGDIFIAIKGSENANLALPNINTQGNLTLNSVGAIRDINNSIICASGICDISTYQSVSGTTTIDAVGSNVTLGSSSSFDTGKLVISNADTVFVETLGRTDLTLGNINASGSIFIQAGGTSNLTLATESVISTSSKNIDAVTLVSGNQFINNNTSGISIQFTGEGTPRWLIYSNDIDNDHRGGLATKPFFNYYGCAYDSGCSVFFPNTENGFIYINQPTITVTADIQEKVYGEIDPVLTYQVDGLKNGDDFSIFIGILNRDSGEDVASYPIRQGTLSTNNNYHIDYVGNNLTIKPATLNLLNFLGNKFYDGTPVFDYTQLEIDPASVLGSDDIILSSGNAEVSSRNAGIYNAFIRNDLSLSGSDAANYSIVGGSVNVVINPAELTINAVTDNRIYDGTINSNGAVSFSGLQTGDTLTKLTQVFDSKHAGSRTLNVLPDYVLNDGNSGLNYSVTLKSAKGIINPAALTINAVTDNRIYDGTINSSGAVNFSGLQTGDALTRLTQVFDSKHAGSRTLDVSPDYVLNDGNSGLNYSVTLKSAKGTINPAVASLNASKIYDGTAQFSTSQINVTGIFGELLTLNGTGLATANSKQVADNDVNYLKDLADLTLANGVNELASDYILPDLTTRSINNNVIITAADINLLSIFGNKIYDGTPIFDYTQLEIDPVSVLGSDDIILSSGNAEVSNRNTGTYHAFIRNNLSLSGSDAANYSLVGGSVNVVINPAELTINAVTDNRIYDGTINSNGAVSFSGLQTGDTLTKLTQVFDSKHAGSRTLNVLPDYVLNEGNGGLNYSVTLKSAKGTINPAVASLNASKIYDGTAQFSTSQINVTGIFGELLTLNGTGLATAKSEQVADNDMNYLKDLADLTLANGVNELASDYILPDLTTRSINNNVIITAADIHLLSIFGNKIYDGTPIFDYTQLEIDPVSVLGSDDVILSSGNAEVSNRNTGTYHAFIRNNLSLSGSDAANYSLVGGSVNVVINPAELTINAVTDSRIYDGTINSSGAVTFSGLQTGDTLTKLTQVFDSKHAGSRTLNVSPDYVLNDGNSGLNYSVTLKSVKGTIDPAVASLNASKIYDGTAQFSTSQINVTGIFGELLTLNGTGLATANSNQVADNDVNYLKDLADLTLANGVNELASDYILPDLTTRSINNNVIITAADIHLLSIFGNKIYDGTPIFDYTQLEIDPGSVLGDDDVLLSSGNAEVSSGNAGIYNAFIRNDLSLSGAEAANYSVLGGSVNVVINPAALTINAITDSRVYDGTTESTAVVTFSGLQIGDTLTELTQVFDSKHAGNRTLNVSPDYVLNDGNRGLNYSVTLKSAKGNINPAALTINAVTDNRIYDGTINSSGAVLFSGLQTGDTLTKLTQVFDSKHAGSRILNVLPNYILNDGNSGLNYSVTLKSAKGTINPAIVLLTAAKDYDGTAQFTASQINVIGIDGELLTLTGSGLAIADSEKSDNTTYLISLNNLTLADGINGSASDYVLPDVTTLSTNSKVIITPVTITVVEQGSETGSGSTQFITRTPTRTVMTMKIDGNTSCVLVEIADLISAVANSANLSSSYDIFKAAIASAMVTVQQTSDAEPSQSVLKQPVVIAQQEEVLQSPDIAQAINLAAIEQNPVIEKQLVTPPLVKSVNVQSKNLVTKEKEKEKDDHCDPQESTFSDQFSLCRRSKK
ncbi:beta strand repeat-containing protein [Chromatium okenii]|nr:YDG domain-containing protein [Chromatium okenii]